MKLLNLCISVYLSLSLVKWPRAREGESFSLARSLALSRAPPRSKSQISVLKGMHDIKYYTQYFSEFLPAHRPRLLAFSRHFHFALPLPRAPSPATPLTPNILQKHLLFISLSCARRCPLPLPFTPSPERTNGER